MVNWVEAQKPLLHGMVKMAGLRQQTVEIGAGTSMTFWVPKSRKTKKGLEKPAVVLIHGFAAEGLVTWQFQVGSLTKDYAVYVPDLLFFGGSVTDSSDRSPDFQAQCLVEALGVLGVKACTVVGFSYGGMVAFKVAEMRPDLVEAMVVSGSVKAMTDSISVETIDRLGFKSSKELLLPESVRGLKALWSVAAHRKIWFPDFLYKDFLEVMFNNRKERAELLEGLIVSNKMEAASAAAAANFPQKIHLLWGEDDQIFNVELAKDMKQQFGDKATFQAIKKAGHLVHLERPCAYNRHLKEFLKHVYANDSK